MGKKKRLTIDDFLEKYKPEANQNRHPGKMVSEFDSLAIYEDMIYDTHEDKDAEKWKECMKSRPNNLWTVIEAEGKQYIVPGYHFVNRMGYIISSVPYTGVEDEFLID